ncbi:PREDICTED: uncharacterized protein LOC105951636 [Erythranthe guttata]|uniref:uncharacterized protein LOC105951636 n=1 Tax=Erythranthe guttata TaxID=4155 RepID=UPI00064DD43A|nr:PREDICTED: uncharacterized protein LOC105951636 [Erythranthe guttata]|eukprot:XP_012830540.1 PREDICTED: uncharacterized protein LOC105951636 [Erythranthe guttata]
MHVLFECQGVKVCWNSLLSNSNYSADQPSAWQWLISMHKDQPADRFLVASVLAWKIWERRNKVIKADEAMNPHDLVGWCSNYLAVFKNAQLRPSPKLQMAHRSDWVSPSPGVVKINIDAAIPNGGESFTVGAVARNEEGICLGWKMVKIHGQLKPVECEAMAALKALTMARDKGWLDVIIEGDCLQVITALQKGERDLSSFGTLVEDCLWLAQNLSSCSFSFVKRMGNKLAHAIAHLSYTDSIEGSVLPPHLAI